MPMTLRMTLRTAIALALALVLCGASAQGGFVLEGRIPPDAPDDAIVEARIGTDLQGIVPEPVATASVDDGRFRLELPGAIDERLLEPEPVDCERERTIDAVFLPYLALVQDGEAVGHLVHTDVPRELWSYAGPPRNASWVYTPDSATAVEECANERLDLAFQPGWNAFVVLSGSDGVTVTTDAPPASFRWVFVPGEP